MCVFFLGRTPRPPYFIQVAFNLKILCTSHLYPLPPTHTYGIGGDSDFSLFRALVIAHPVGQADGNNPLLLAPPYTTEKSHLGKDSNVKPPALRGQSKVIVLHSSATPVGEGVDTMTGALLS